MDFFRNVIDFYSNNMVETALLILAIIAGLAFCFFQKKTEKMQNSSQNIKSKWELEKLSIRKVLEIENKAEFVLVFMENILNEKHFAYDVYHYISDGKTYQYSTVANEKITSESMFKKFMNNKVFKTVNGVNYDLLRGINYSFIDRDIVGNVKMMTIHKFKTHIQIYFTFEDVKVDTIVYQPKGDYLKTLIEHYEKDDFQSMFSEISKQKNVLIGSEQ